MSALTVRFMRRVPGFQGGLGAPPTAITFPSPSPDYSAKDSIVPQSAVLVSAASPVTPANSLAYAEMRFHGAVAAELAFPAGSAGRTNWNDVAAAYFAVYDAINNQGVTDPAVISAGQAQADGLWTSAAIAYPAGLVAAVPAMAAPTAATSKKWPWILGGVVVLAGVGTAVGLSMHKSKELSGFGDGGSGFGAGFAGGLVGGAIGTVGGLTVAGLIERSAINNFVAAQTAAMTTTAPSSTAVPGTATAQAVAQLPGTTAAGG